MCVRKMHSILFVTRPRVYILWSTDKPSRNLCSSTFSSLVLSHVHVHYPHLLSALPPENPQEPLWKREILIMYALWCSASVCRSNDVVTAVIYDFPFFSHMIFLYRFFLVQSVKYMI